jgi:hypothetical protein
MSALSHERESLECWLQHEATAWVYTRQMYGWPAGGAGTLEQWLKDLRGYQSALGAQGEDRERHE